MKDVNQTGKQETDLTIQKMFIESYDREFNENTVETVGYDGQNLQRILADALNVKITEDGSITYIGLAAPGTAQSTAKWQCIKIDSSSGTIITYADGNSDFDNSATDLTALSYS